MPAAAAAVIFCPAVFRGESLFLRFAWDANNILAFFPWDVFSARQFAAGLFPLWNPHNACGVPHLANWQTAALYPLHLLLFLHPAKWAFDLFFIVRYAILAVGVRLAARALRLSEAGTGAAVAAAAFSGYFIAYGPMVHINVEILFPYTLWLIARQKEKWRFPDLLGLTAVFAFSYLGGNGESAFFVAGFACAFSLWLAILEKKKIFFGCIGAAFIGFIIASPQILPFLEYLPHAWHIHEAGAGSQYLDPSGLYSIMYVFPGRLDGSFIPYLGAGVLLLAALGAPLDKKSVFFFSMTALIIALTYGLPIIKWLSYLPILSRTASYKYALAPMAVMAALLAGRGIDGIINGEITGARIRRTALSIFAFGAAFPLGAWIEGREFRLSGFFASVAVLVVVVFAAHIIESRRAKSGEREFNGIAAIIVAALAVELIISAHLLNMKELLDPDIFAAKPEVKYLVEKQGDFRTASIQTTFPSNLNIIAGVNDANLLDALYPKSYFRKISRAYNFAPSDGEKYFKDHGYSFPAPPESAASGILRGLGVKYYLGKEYSGAGLKWVIGDLWEDEAAAGILSIDGVDAHRSDATNPQDSIWRGNAPAVLLRARITLLPGWRAYADGTEIAITEWDEIFIEVKPPNAAKEFRLRYMPWGFRIGLWSGLTGVLFFICAAISAAVSCKRLQRHSEEISNE